MSLAMGTVFTLHLWTARCILGLWQEVMTTLPAVCQWGWAPIVLNSQVTEPLYVPLLDTHETIDDKFGTSSCTIYEVLGMRHNPLENSNGGAGSVLWAVASPPQVHGAPAHDSALSSAWCLCGAKSGSGMALQDLTSKPFALPAVSHASFLPQLMSYSCIYIEDTAHGEAFICTRQADAVHMPILHDDGSFCRLEQSARPLSCSRRTQSMKRSCRLPFLCRQLMMLHAYHMPTALSACLLKVRLKLVPLNCSRCQVNGPCAVLLSGCLCICADTWVLST